MHFSCIKLLNHILFFLPLLYLLSFCCLYKLFIMLFSMVKFLFSCCLNFQIPSFCPKIKIVRKIWNFYELSYFLNLQRGSTWGKPGGPTTLPHPSWARQGCGPRPHGVWVPHGPPRGEPAPSLFLLPSQTRPENFLSRSCSSWARIFRSPCSAHFSCWNLARLLSGMWLFHVSN